MTQVPLEDRIQTLEKKVNRMQNFILGLFCMMLFLVTLLGFSLSKLGTAFSKSLEAQVQHQQSTASTQ